MYTKEIKAVYEKMIAIPNHEELAPMEKLIYAKKLKAEFLELGVSIRYWSSTPEDKAPLEWVSGIVESTMHELGSCLTLDDITQDKLRDISQALFDARDGSYKRDSLHHDVLLTDAEAIIHHFSCTIE